jgi:hypothetical protein
MTRLLIILTITLYVLEWKGSPISFDMTKSECDEVKTEIERESGPLIDLWCSPVERDVI